MRRFVVLASYVGAITAANWLTAEFGQVPIGFGLLVAAGTFAAGIALLARNLGQDIVGRGWIALFMALGVALSWRFATPALAEASAAAFALSETADMLVYGRLKKRGKPLALLVAGALGAVVDTLVFLHLAGFPIDTRSIGGQLLIKAGISAIASAALLLSTRHSREHFPERGAALRYFANPSTQEVRDAMIRRTDLGAITTPRQGNRIPSGVRWCADNGVFGKGFPGEEEWFAWLAALPYDKALCEFAVAPDVVGDAAATLARSLPWLPRIRTLGMPAALVAQNGQEILPVPWDAFDVLFIGGDTAWKLSRHARQLATEAKIRGKRVHMGRVNSFRRIVTASLINCDSADGTTIAFGPRRNLPVVEGWLDDLNHGCLFAGFPDRVEL